MVEDARNTRLGPLRRAADRNRAGFEDLCGHLVACGWTDLRAFVNEPDAARCRAAMAAWIARPPPPGTDVHDGLERPYKTVKGRWLMLGWVLRDAPEQRLRPLLCQIDGPLPERMAHLLDVVREDARTELGDDPDYWGWVAIREVIRQRLEGSRRALRGTGFEGALRSALRDVLDEEGIALVVPETPVAAHGETFDVSASGPRGRVLLPVKTRETQGGGHSHIFTRDLEGPVRAAEAAGDGVIAVVVARSWMASLQQIGCPVIRIEADPDPVVLADTLREALRGHLDLFRRAA